MSIERTLFWFKDGDVQLTTLSNDYFGLGCLMTRLLNEKFDGKKLKFINLEFSTLKTYEIFPVLPKDTPYYYGGHLKYYGVLDLDFFMSLSKVERTFYIWENAFKYLVKSASTLKNSNLTESATYAYNKGAEMNLNPDFRVVDTEVILQGEKVRASVWINFKEEGMHSKLTLEQHNGVIFEKELDKTKNGVEVFLELYKAIVVEGDNIVVKGRRDAENLPLKIPYSEIFNKVK